MNLLLALVLALASQTEAVARSEMAGAVAMELCGAGMVLLDAKGQPLAPCQHCLAAQAQALAGALPPLKAPLVQSRALPRPAAVRSPARPAPPPSARSPPAAL